MITRNPPKTPSAARSSPESECLAPLVRMKILQIPASTNDTASTVIAIGALSSWTKAPPRADPVVCTTELLCVRALLAWSRCPRSTNAGMNDVDATALKRVPTPASRAMA